MMSTKSETMIDQLLRAVPELSATYREHLDDNDELLPHVFLGDVTRFVIGHVADSSDAAMLQKLLDELELEYRAGDEEIRELIGASFLENLIGENAALKCLTPMMGPCLREAAQTICGA